MNTPQKNGRGGARKGAGRPAKAASERRDKIVTAVLTQGEFATIEAARGDERRNDWIRAVILRAAKRQLRRG